MFTPFFGANAANHRENKGAERSDAALFCPSEFALLCD